MTVKIRSEINRIILLFIAAGMILGLFYSAVCDESYGVVHEAREYRNEMSAPALPIMPDLITHSSANAETSHFLTEKGRPGRLLLTSTDNTGRADSKDHGIFFSACINIFLLSALPGTSLKHIFYIHLKDGNK